MNFIGFIKINKYISIKRIIKSSFFILIFLTFIVFFLVIRTSYAQQKTVIDSSGDFGGLWIKENIIDGNLSTGWCTPGRNSMRDEWITIDFGKEKTFNEVKILNRDEWSQYDYFFPINFSIQVSNDGNNWNTVVEVYNYNRPHYWNGFSFDTVTARYLKIYITKSHLFKSNEYYTCFNEVEILNISNICGNYICEKGETETNCHIDCSEKGYIKEYVTRSPSKENEDYIDFVSSYGDIFITDLYNESDVLNYMKSLNPNLRLLVYRDLYGTHDNKVIYFEDWDIVNKHEDWFFHDSNNRRLIHKDYCTYFMNVGNKGWENHYASIVKDILNNNDYLDGVYADNALNLNGFIYHITHSSFALQNETVTVGNDGKTLTVSHNIYNFKSNLSWAPKFKDCDTNGFIYVYNNSYKSGFNYYIGGNYSEKTITIGTFIRPGTRVYVSYPTQRSSINYLINSWIKGMTEMLRTVRKNIPDKLFIINGGGGKTPSEYIEFINGKMNEGFAHAYWADFYYNKTITQWKNDIDELIDMGNKNKIYLTKCGSIFKKGIKESDIRRMMNFCLTSYLLGANNFSLFQFYYPGISPGYYSEMHINLKQPLEKYYKVENNRNIYARHFEKGMVIVNPSENLTENVTLGKTYYTLCNGLVDNVVLRPQEGIILMNENNFSKNWHNCARVINSSGDFNNEWRRGNVIDNDYSTGWCTPGRNSMRDEWITIDFGKEKTFNEVKILNRDEWSQYDYFFPINFSIQVSNDGNNWNTVKDINGYQTLCLSPPCWNSFKINKINTRYLRIYIRKTHSYSGTYYACFNEIDFSNRFYADITGDGIVDIFDLLIVNSNFCNNCVNINPPEVDITGDGKVDIFDLVVVGKNFGKKYK